MKRITLASIFLIILLLPLFSINQIEDHYNELVNIIIKSEKLDMRRIAIFNRPTLKRSSYYGVELDYAILGPKVQTMEESAFIGCDVKNLIIFNPELEYSSKAFTLIFGDKEVDKIDQRSSPNRVITDAPFEYLKRLIFDNIE